AGKAGSAFGRKVAGGRTTVGRVPGAVVNAATKTRLDFVDPKVPSFIPDAVVRFAYTKGKEAVELAADEKFDSAYPLGKWTWTKPEALKGKLADAAKVMNI